MTHAYLAIKSLDSPKYVLKFQEGDEFLIGEKSNKELKKELDELIKKKVVKELTEKEALEINKQQNGIHI